VKLNSPSYPNPRPPKRAESVTPTVTDELKRRRDDALVVWRQELQKLSQLEKWLVERRQRIAPDVRTQRRVVDEARVRYDKANEEYLNGVHLYKLTS
jgi:hypothetical protein